MAPRTTRSMKGLTTDEIVRCLKDGTRDMTTVIFRQVPQMAIFDEDADLRGTPLYRVAFCPASPTKRDMNSPECRVLDSEHSDSNHQHVIWHIGDDLLYRCRLPESYESWTGYRPVGTKENRYGNNDGESIKTVVRRFVNDEAAERVNPDMFHPQDSIVVNEEGIVEYNSVTWLPYNKPLPKPATKSDLRVLEKLIMPGVLEAKAFRSNWMTNHEALLACKQLYLTGLNR